MEYPMEYPMEYFINMVRYLDKHTFIYFKLPRTPIVTVPCGSRIGCHLKIYGDVKGHIFVPGIILLQ